MIEMLEKVTGWLANLLQGLWDGFIHLVHVGADMVVSSLQSILDIFH